MTVGKRIKALRNERGLTQLELASSANISRSYLAGVETGKYNPSLKTLESIARALNVDVATLLQEDENMKKLERQLSFAKSFIEFAHRSGVDTTEYEKVVEEIESLMKRAEELMDKLDNMEIGK